MIQKQQELIRKVRKQPLMLQTKITNKYKITVKSLKLNDETWKYEGFLYHKTAPFPRV